jgi:uncharacterized delta-60 repeat protein
LTEPGEADYRESSFAEEATPMTPHRPILCRMLLAAVLLIACADVARAVGLDSTFGGDGVVAMPVGTDAAANAIVVQPDGNIVAAGRGNNSGDFVALARYETNGSLDATFGTGGVVSTAVGASAYAAALVRQTDDKLVIAGSTTSGSTQSILVARYESDGTLDAGFGAGGIVVTTLALPTTAAGVALESDGKIVVIGTVGTGDAADLVVLRYDTAGRWTPPSTATASSRPIWRRPGGTRASPWPSRPTIKSSWLRRGRCSAATRRRRPWHATRRAGRSIQHSALVAWSSPAAMGSPSASSFSPTRRSCSARAATTSS